MSWKNSKWYNTTLVFLSSYLVFFFFLWGFGIDGFIWLLFLPLLVKNYRFDDAKFPFNKYLLFGLFIYISSVLVSGLFLSSTFRILNWIRDTAAIITFFLLLLFVANLNATSLRKKVVRPLKIFFGVAIGLGLLALIFRLNFSFRTPFAYLMPSSILSTDYGSRLVIKSLVNESYFLNIRYFRLSSIFAYATSFSYALAVFLVAYITNPRISDNHNKYFKIFFIVGGIICLLFTTARTGLAGFIGGTGLYYFLRANSRQKVLLVILLLLSIVAFLMQDIFQLLLEARGGGSAHGRSTVYLMSLKRFFTNPLGFGSYVDARNLNLPYPLGSHSTWIGILFKHGLFGFIGFTLCFFGIYKEKSVRFFKSRHSYRILPTLVPFFAISLLEEFYLDILTTISLALILGIIINESDKLFNKVIKFKKELIYESK